MKKILRRRLGLAAALIIVCGWTAGFSMTARALDLSPAEGGESSSQTEEADSTSQESAEEEAARQEEEEQKKQDIKDLNSQLSDLEAQQKAIENQIAQTQSQKAQELANKRNISSQIDLTQQEVEILIQKIDALEQQIEEKKAQIQELEESIESNYELYKQRLRSMYMTGSSTSPLSVLLGAEDFGDMLIQTELLKRVSQHDTDLLNQLTADKEELEEVKASLDADVKDLDASKALLEEKEEELGVQLNNSEMKIQEYAEDEQAFLAQKEELMAARAQLQKELEQIFASMGSIGDYVGGEFAWPLVGYTYISSGFGWRFGGTDYHTGIDITGGGVNGKAISAANSGQVTYVGYAPNAYGNYLIIDHGGGKSTLYAHCSSIDVSVGDTVVRGQTIAKVGSTGWSTGPHLHFEIRIDGKAQDPMTFY